VEALPYPVLTNNTYEQSVSSHTHATTKGNNSLERFSMACNKISQLNSNNRETSLVEKSFDILNAVNQGDYTKWSIVYDITEKKNLV
jgi:choloylglycine hydrolase